MIKDYKDEDKNQDQEELKEEVLEEEVTPEAPEDPGEEDQEEVKEEEKEDPYKDQFIRLTADFTNYKRRAEKEKKDYLQLGVKKIALDILTVVDNFERAIDHREEDSVFAEGVELIYSQLVDVLKKNDIVEMEAEGKTFDPNLHHAVLVEARDGVDEGIVLEVVQKGYMLKDEVLRPAMVKVSQ